MFVGGKNGSTVGFGVKDWGGGKLMIVNTMKVSSKLWNNGETGQYFDWSTVESSARAVCCVSKIVKWKRDLNAIENAV